MDGSNVQALVESEAPVFIIKKATTNLDNVDSGKTLSVQSYDEKRQFPHRWITVVLVLQGQCGGTAALVMDTVEYDFLLSMPDRRQLRANIYWIDEISV